MTKRASTARSRSSATASTSSASPSRRSASRARTRSRSRSPASPIPAAPPRSSARPRRSSSTTSRATSTGPSIDANGIPVASPKLLPLLLEPAGAGRGGRAERVVPLRGRRSSCSAGPGTTKEAVLAQPRPRQGARGLDVVRGARRPEDPHLRPTDRPCARASDRVPRHADVLLPRQVPADRRRATRSRRSPARISSRRERVRTSTRRPTSRSSPSSSPTRAATGSTTSPATSPSAGSSRRTSSVRPSRLFQHFAIVLDDQIRSWPADRLQGAPGRDLGRPRRRSRGSTRSARRRTSRSSSRPARCRTRSSRSTAPTCRPPSAPTRCARPDRRARRPRAGGDLPAASSTASSALIAIIGLAFYRDLPLRRDPALRRHADASRASPA